MSIPYSERQVRIDSLFQLVSCRILEARFKVFETKAIFRETLRQALMNELVVPSEEHGRSFYAPAPKKPEAEKIEEVAEPRVSTRKCGMGSGWLCMACMAVS